MTTKKLKRTTQKRKEKTIRKERGIIMREKSIMAYQAQTHTNINVYSIYTYEERENKRRDTQE